MPKIASFGAGSAKNLGFQGYRIPSPSGQVTATYPSTVVEATIVTLTTVTIGTTANLTYATTTTALLAGTTITVTGADSAPCGLLPSVYYVSSTPTPTATTCTLTSTYAKAIVGTRDLPATVSGATTGLTFTASGITNGLVSTGTGTFTWTAPAFVTKVNMIMVGGGGGGGGRGKTGGGGGGGALTYANTVPVIPGTTYNITVGAGGAVNSDGGATWFNNSTYLYANGGLKGTKTESDVVNETLFDPNTSATNTGTVNDNYYSSSQISSINGGNTFSDGTMGRYSTYYWLCPVGVWSINVICVGAGGSGGSQYTVTAVSGAGGQGGSLSYKNSISVTPGITYFIDIGMRGSNATNTTSTGPSSGNSNGGTVGGDTIFYNLYLLTVTRTETSTNYITITGSDASSLVVNAAIKFNGTLGGITAGNKYIIGTISTINSKTVKITVKDRWGGSTLGLSSSTGSIPSISTNIMAAGGASGFYNTTNITLGSVLGNGENGFKLGDGGGHGGLGGVSSPGQSNGQGGGGAGGYSGNGGNGGTGGFSMTYTAGAAGSGGGGGGGSSGAYKNSAPVDRAPSGAGGGVGLYGAGSSGTVSGTPTSSSNPTTYSGNPGSGGRASTSLLYSNASVAPCGPYSTTAYGAGGGGNNLSSTAIGSGGFPGDGVLRIFSSAGKSFPSNAAQVTNATASMPNTTVSSYGFQGGGGGGAAGYSGNGGNGGTYSGGGAGFGGAGGTAFSGTITNASITSYAGGAGGTSNLTAGVNYDAATNPGGGSAAGGAGGHGPIGGGGVSYLGPTATDNLSNTTTAGAATTNGTSAVATKNGGSKGGSGTGGNTGTGVGGTGGGGGPGGAFGGAGGAGFLRIIWGEGRQYPSTLVMDLFQAGTFISGTNYTVAVLGTTSQYQWNILAGTSGQTYIVGTTFTPTSTITGSYGTGTAYKT